MSTAEYIEKLLNNHIEFDMENYRLNKKDELLKKL